MKKTTIKKIYNTLAIFILSTIIAIVIISSFGIVSYLETHYVMECQVVKVNNISDTITLVDYTGNEWEAYATKLKQGNMVKVIFDDNMTINRFDDKIVSIEKINK